jgi:hypothetical protein
MTPALGQFVQEAHAMVRQRHLARHRHLAPTDQPHIRNGLMQGARRGRMMTNAVRPPVRPETWWLCVPASH